MPKLFHSFRSRTPVSEQGVDAGDTISLQHNENYWMLEDDMVAAYSNASATTFTTYPDYTQLHEALARYAGVANSMVCATAGSDAAVRLIAEYCLAQRSRVLLPLPTFYGYERIFGQIGLPFDVICYGEENNAFVFPTQTVVERIRAHQTDVLFLCQPNNPLGSLIPTSDMDAMLDAAQAADVLVVVDEAYYEFAGYTAKARLGLQPLIILRTLSKSFGLAGARVGYYLAEPMLIEKIQSRSLPWPIAHLSVSAAFAGLEHASDFRARIDEIKRERNAFSHSLEQVSGIRVSPSDTNFIFIRMPQAQRLADALAHRGIKVAYCGGMSSIPEVARMLGNGIRLTVPAPWHQKRVLDAFVELATIDK